MTKDTEVPFEISIVGEETQEKWVGKFSALRRLSHRQQLLRSRIRRDFLGSHPDHATQTDLIQAIMLSELAVSIVKAPKWWAETDGGQEMVDGNVLEAIFEKIQAIRTEDEKAEAAKTKEDAKALKKAVENPEETESDDEDEDE